MSPWLIVFHEFTVRVQANKAKAIEAEGENEDDKNNKAIIKTTKFKVIIKILEKKVEEYPTNTLYLN